MHLQFNSYDYNKIYSHAGVRSDSFSRPLDKALITDFFGGVAQVEVLPPSAEVFKSSSLQDASSNDNTASGQMKEMDSTGEERLRAQPPRLSDPWWDAASSMLRAWGSVGLVGVLIGWVATRN